MASLDLDSLLKLLQVTQLKTICQTLKLSVNGKSSMNKTDMIRSLIKLCTSQPSVAQSKFFVTLKPDTGVSKIETKIRLEYIFHFFVYIYKPMLN